MIQLLYFAQLRDQLGVDRESLPWAAAEPPRTVADLLVELRARGGPWAETLAEGRPVLVAVNQEMARPDTPIQPGDEVGLFPPVTGG